MNASDSQIGDSQTGDSLLGDPHSAHPGAARAIAHDPGDPLQRLGRLLRGHTWRDSPEWARALDQLSRLSDEDLKRVVDVVP